MPCRRRGSVTTLKSGCPCRSVEETLRQRELRSCGLLRSIIFGKRAARESCTVTTMGKSAKERKDAKLKLKQPDRSGPDPSQQTLLDLAEQRGLLKTQPGEKVAGEAKDDEPPIGRLAESILWSLSITMLHFTLDVLVSHQYAMEVEWPAIIRRAAQAFPGITSHFSFTTLLIAYSSHTPPLLLVPPTSVTLNSPSHSSSSNTTCSPSTTLHHRQRWFRLLSHIHHQREGILCPDEAGPTGGVSLDMVCHRVGSLVGDCEPAVCWSILEIQWLFIPLITQMI